MYEQSFDDCSRRRLTDCILAVRLKQQLDGVLDIGSRLFQRRSLRHCAGQFRHGGHEPAVFDVLINHSVIVSHEQPPLLRLLNVIVVETK